MTLPNRLGPWARSGRMNVCPGDTDLRAATVTMPYVHTALTAELCSTEHTDTNQYNDRNKTNSNRNVNM